MSFLICLKSVESGNYLSVDKTGSYCLSGNKQELLIEFNDDMTLSLRCATTDRGDTFTYLSASDDRKTFQYSNNLGEREEFSITILDSDTPAHRIAFKTKKFDTWLAVKDNQLCQVSECKDTSVQWEYSFAPFMLESAFHSFVGVSKKGDIKLLNTADKASELVPVLSPRGRIGLKACNGQFLSALDDGTIKLKPHLDHWEEFFIKQEGHDHPNLRLHTAHHSYVCAWNDGNLVQTTKRHEGGLENFHVVFASH